MRVLIADDDETIRSELGDLLREEGHEVTSVPDGEQASQVLESKAFDVVLLDLRMPGASGLEVLRVLQERRSGTAAIMITGHGTIDAAVEAMKAGAVDFIVKPFEIEALQRTLKAIANEIETRHRVSPVPSPEGAGRQVMEDARRRGALLAILGPAATTPRGIPRVLRVGKEAGPGMFLPHQLHALNAEAEEHVQRTERPVIYIEDLGPLEERHGREDLKAWVDQLSRRCGAKGGSVVLSRADAALATGILADADEFHRDPRLQGMLESLANPIRRAIVSSLFGTGPVSYSAILRRNLVDSSPKLSFHLQKLQADGLLAKGKDGAYGLTEDARKAWSLVRALIEEGRPPALVVSDE